MSRLPTGWAEVLFCWKTRDAKGPRQAVSGRLPHLDGLVIVCGVDKVGGAPVAGHSLLAGVQVHGDDAGGPARLQAVYHRQPHRADAKHRRRGALLYLRTLNTWAGKRCKVLA